MIVTTSNKIGLDKIKLFVPDYRIKDATKSGFLVVSGTIDLSTGETTDQDLFRDSGGTTVRGTKAIRNTEYYQTTITPSGLIVQVNPSKPFHPYELVNDDDILKQRMNLVFKDLESNGVQASWNNSKLTRIDIARNVLLSGSVSSFGQVWPWINQKRSKYSRQYPEGYGTGNESWGTIFYDKGKECGQYPSNDLLRAEIQFKRGRTIVDNLGCKHYSQLFELGLEAIQDVYRTTMLTKVLKPVQGLDQFAISYNDEIDVLKKLYSRSPRTAISKHLQLIGIPNFLETYRSPDIYAEVLIKSGFSRMTVNRQLKQIKKQIELHTILYKDQRNTVGKLLRELTTKLAA